MRFSLVFISFGTPIFISSIELQVHSKRETYLAGDCFSPAPWGPPPSWFLAGTETHHCLSRWIEEFARQLVNCLGLDRFDQREHLVERTVWLAVQVDRGCSIHPCGGTLERQRYLS